MHATRASTVLPLLALTLSSYTACGSCRTPPPPAVPAGALQSVGEATRHFGVELFARLRTSPGNLAFSPGSAWIALAMTHAGARTQTEAEMRRVLHLPADTSAAQAAAGALLATWNDASRTTYTLRVVNRLFGQSSVPFERPFLELLQNTFGAPLERVDFARDPEAARARVNEWVARQTQDRIRDLLPPRSIDSRSRLVLTNAVYLLARWLHPFQPEETHDAAFHGPGGTTAAVPTMHQTARLRLAELGDVQVLEMPYEGGDLAMSFVLPRAQDGLGAVEARLDDATLASWLGAGETAEVAVSLPKFTIDPPAPAALAEELKALGMPTAFDETAADFRGMAPERLHISDVFHKAFVKVEERGTEAAAATAAVMIPMGIVPQPPREFRADHPFLFFLRDLRSGVILFAGRVEKP
jgi:serpin B